MSSYFLGVYKHDSAFPPNPTILVLEEIAKHLPEFFPAKMYVSSEEFINIESPKDFLIESVPNEYWIEKDESVRIPINGNNNVELIVIDDKKSTAIPSNVTITWETKEELPNLSNLEFLLCSLSAKLNADYGYITDEDTRNSDKIYDRMFEINIRNFPLAVFWINWFGEKYIESLGLSPSKSLKNIFSSKPCQKGIILTLQAEPFEFSNNEHLNIQTKAEKELGLIE